MWLAAMPVPIFKNPVQVKRVRFVQFEKLIIVGSQVTLWSKNHAQRCQCYIFRPVFFVTPNLLPPSFFSFLMFIFNDFKKRKRRKRKIRGTETFSSINSKSLYFVLLT